MALVRNDRQEEEQMTNEALTIENIEFAVKSQIGRAPHWTMVRELTMNAIEAAAKASGAKTAHWTTGTYEGVRKAVIWNTGPGMDASELKRATNLACEVGKNLGLDDNFGVGAKVSSLPNNRIGMRFRSCKNGRVSEIIIGEDPDTHVFVRFERDIGGKTDTVIDVTAVAQREGRDTSIDWTEVMLLGNSLDQDTAARPISANPSPEKAFIANSLYRRFYRLPTGVKVRLDSVYHRFADSSRIFSPIGERYDRFERAQSVEIPNFGITVHFLHDPPIGDKSGLRKSSSGALSSTTTTCCLVHKEEMYSVMTGQEWSAAAPRFGIPFGSKELCVHIELDDNEARPSQYRERLISKQTGEDIVPDDFAFAVVEIMPDWVKEIIKNAFPRRAEDYSDLQRELQDLLNRYKVKVPGRRIEASGQPSSEDAGEHAAAGRGEGRGGGIPDSKRVRTPRRRFHNTPEGATTTALYEIYEKAPEIIMLDTPEQVEEKGLRSKAAEFVVQTGMLFVNGLYEAVDRTIADIEPEYIGQADPEALRNIMVTAARNAMAFRVGKATVFALAKRANQDWTESDMMSALTKESLSIAADNYGESLTQVRRAIRDEIKMARAAA
jgi:hypothetical protein